MSRGAYKNSGIVNNRFTAVRYAPAYKLIPGVKNLDKSESIVNTIAAKVLKLGTGNFRKTSVLNSAVDLIIQQQIDLYNPLIFYRSYNDFQKY